MSDLSEISKNENGEGSMSRNAIKYLAMAAMFCNHFAYIFLKEGSTGQEVMVDIGYSHYYVLFPCGRISLHKICKELCTAAACIRDPFTDTLHAGIETDEPEHDVQPSSMSGSGVGCRSCKT